MKKIYLYILFISVCFSACDTTSRIGEGEVLYTGVKKIRMEPEQKGVKIESDAESAVKEALSVKPNNALFSPYVRWPFPFGLWVYNHVTPTRDKGFKHWFYERFAKTPVLISTAQPDLRVAVVPQILDNYGYFGSSATYELLYNRRNPKKARIDYRVVYGTPYRYSSIEFPRPSDPITALVDSSRAATLLHVGNIYNAATLSAERDRITRDLRNRGYYYFRPDYLAYFADTTLQPYSVALRMQVRPNIPPDARRTYRVGNVAFDLKSLTGQGIVDTMHLSHLNLFYQRPHKVRLRFLERNITLYPGDLYTLDRQEESLNSLMRMGVFRYVNLSVAPHDTSGVSDLLDITIEASMDTPMEAWFEANVTSSTSSFIGPGVIFGLAHKNIFGGGERLSLELSGSYEWQTGKRRSGDRRSLLNSYEFGVNASLTFPRLLPSSLLWDTRIERRYGGKTIFSLGADLMNRPRYFRMLSLNLAIALDFQSSRYSFHTFHLPKLSYDYLFNSTAEFDSTLAANPAIALSFRNQLIPVLGYTYRYDRSFGYKAANRIFWQATLSTAGNLMNAVMSGSEGSKKFLGIPFSQFVKPTLDFRYYRRLWGDSWLATRFMVGAGWAYGNSSVLPYSEQFYIGGANSIRAFTIRSVGPGSYAPPADKVDSYLDQTGDFKMEMNAEWRFPIIGDLHGAMFLDAGNIWLLRADENRPGGTLDMKNFGKDIALGTGVGLRYDLSFLVIRLDMGIGLHDPSRNDRPHYYNMESFGRSLSFHLAIGYPF